MFDILKQYKLLNIDLQLFAINLTTDSDLSVEMKTYYDSNLLDNAEPELVHNQFGQKRPIPKNGGKIIEFRKFTSLPKATTALTEGTTPAGKSLAVTNVTATVAQYGDFVEVSDLLEMTAIDNNLVEATRLLGSQAGRTLDTITREVLNGGTNVQYGASAVTSRYKLVGGESSGNHYLTVDCIKRAVRYLKAMNTSKINGDFVALIHPDCTYDLTNDTAWQYPHQYQDTTELYTGEIGKIAGCRFAETTEAKIFHAADLVAEGSTNEARTLTVASLSTKTFTIDEPLSAAEVTALVGRKVIIKGVQYTIASGAAGAAGAATVTVSETVTGSPTDGEVIYPGEAGAKGRDVYSTIVLGADAYGVVEIAGGGLQFIAKQLGSSGTADPLNQRATSGWKATHVAVRLAEEHMIRVETCTTFSDLGAN